ncbi:hypothetical protein Mapa_015299 [Marchantia paleacea]|nr:hypothetical protein Mapa_015299 [Marchantia paleacea]
MGCFQKVGQSVSPLNIFNSVEARTKRGYKLMETNGHRARQTLIQHPTHFCHKGEKCPYSCDAVVGCC